MLARYFAQSNAAISKSPRKKTVAASHKVLVQGERIWRLSRQICHRGVFVRMFPEG